jgi:two-component system response regulator LytT
MIQIALVDDDEAASNELQEKLQNLLAENGEQFSISTYHEAVSFLDHYQSVDIVFMDVEMPYLNGIAAAQKLRQIDEKVALIYVTNYMQYAVEGYEVNALGYLLKPINYARLSSVLKKTLNLLLQEAKGFLVKTSSGLKKVYPDELMYIEISGHLIEIHTKRASAGDLGLVKRTRKEIAGGPFCAAQ